MPDSKPKSKYQQLKEEQKAALAAVAEQECGEVASKLDEVIASISALDADGVSLKSIKPKFRELRRALGILDKRKSSVAAETGQEKPTTQQRKDKIEEILKSGDWMPMSKVSNQVIRDLGGLTKADLTLVINEICEKEPLTEQDKEKWNMESTRGKPRKVKLKT